MLMAMKSLLRQELPGLDGERKWEKVKQVDGRWKLENKQTSSDTGLAGWMDGGWV